MLSLLKSVNVNPKGRTWKGCRVLRDSLQHPVTLPPNNVVSQRETALWLPLALMWVRFEVPGVRSGVSAPNHPSSQIDPRVAQRV